MYQQLKLTTRDFSTKNYTLPWRHRMSVKEVNNLKYVLHRLH